MGIFKVTPLLTWQQEFYSFCWLYFLLRQGQTITQVADLNNTPYTYCPEFTLINFKGKLYTYHPHFYQNNFSFDGTKKGPGFEFPINHYLNINDSILILEKSISHELFQYDGITNKKLVSCPSDIEKLVWFNNGLYYTSSTGLWKIEDTTAINISGLPNIQRLIVCEKHLLIITVDQVLWIYNGIDPPYHDPKLSNAIVSTLKPFHGKLAYAANNDTFGVELWIYDFINPPELIADINKGASGSNPRCLQVINDQLFFYADTALTPGLLWEYDGTGVPVVSHLLDGTPVELPDVDDFGVLINGKLYTNPDGLWVFDGVNPPRILDSEVGRWYSRLTWFQDKLYFFIYMSHVGGCWKMTDEINPAEHAWFGDTYGSNPSCKTVFKDTLYFLADDGGGIDLWAYNGKGNPYIAKEISRPSNPNFPTKILKTNEELIIQGDRFIITFDGSNSYTFLSDSNVYIEYVWPASDGFYYKLHLSSSEQASLWYMNKNHYSKRITEMDYFFSGIVCDNRFLTTTPDETYGRELYFADTAGHYSILADLVPGSGDSNPQLPVMLKNNYYFTAKDESQAIWLWKYNFNMEFPEKVINIEDSTGSRYFGRFTFQEQLFFMTENGVYFLDMNNSVNEIIKGDFEEFYISGNCLYLRDGSTFYEYTGKGTPVLMDLPYNAHNFISYRDKTFFDGWDGTSYFYQYDHENKPVPIFKPAADLVLYKKKIYFTAPDKDNQKELFVMTFPDSVLHITACDPFRLNSHVIHESGVYFDTISDIAGLDSIIELHLFILPKSTSFQGISSCNSFLSPSGRYNWTTSGVYTDTIPNSAGCDSIIQIDLAITHVDVTVIQNGNALISANYEAGHQWINVDNGNQPLPNDTSYTFLPDHSGRYAVIITQGTCVDTSSVYTVNITGNEQFSNGNIQLYPNPTDGKVTIDLGKICDEATVTIMNSTGMVVQELKIRNSQKGEIRLNEPGMYLVKVRTGDEETIHRVIKQ
ncbi:MAG TPA: T9SS type A sorting domain-containing protein [Bacteroidales bacterium]|nr:T9SS type A sorting domain-containing protein [Bacteroidales bacterium]